ncbi:MAG: hypothetical protein ACOX1P_23685 [Thermoguttaceae bacterium]
MASPFKVFRKNQKLMLAILTIVAMGGFVVLPTVIQIMSGGGRAMARRDVVTTKRYGNIDLGSMSHLRQDRQTVKGLVGRIDNLVRTKQQNWRGQTVAQSLQARLSSEDRGIVETWLLVKRAEELGLVVNDAAVNAFLTQLLENAVSQDELLGVLKEMGLPETQLFRLLKYELMAMRLQDLVFTSLLPTTPGERWDYYQRLQRQATVELAEVPVDRLIGGIAEPPDKTLNAFFEKYKSREYTPGSTEPGFMVPKQIAIDYFKVDYDHLFTDEELRKYYEENKEEFKRERLPEADKAAPPSELKGGLPGLDDKSLDLSPTPTKEEAAQPPAAEGAKSPKADSEPKAETPAAQTAKPGPADKPAGDAAQPPAAKPATGESPAKQSTDKPAPKPEPNMEAGTATRPLFHLTAYQAANETPASDEKPAEPAKKEPAPSEKPAEPAKEKPAPSEKPAEPAKEKPAPSEKPAEPAKEKPAPSEKPAEPAKEKPAPSEKPAEPAKEKPGPSEKPAEPAKEKPAPSEKPAEPAKEKPAPSEKPAEPAKEKPAPSEKPAEPAKEKPAPSEKPAEPAKKEPALSEKPAEPAKEKPAPSEKPAEPPKEAPAAPQLPEYYSFEEVKSQIQAKLAPDKIEQIFRPLENQMAIYHDAHVRYIQSQDASGKATVAEPSRPDFAKLAADAGIEAKTTQLMSQLQARDLDIGSSTISWSGQSVPFLSYAYESLAILRAARSQDMEGNYYLFWKTNQTDQRTPELSDSGVREMVVDAWKRIEARDKAMQEAERLAEKARAKKASLAESLAGEKDIVVRTTEPFTWIDRTSVSLALYGYGAPRLSTVHLASKSAPAADKAKNQDSAEAETLPLVGNDFMQAVAILQPGEVGVAWNEPKTVVYAIRVLETSPPADDLRQMFLTSANPQQINVVARLDRWFAYQDWVKGLEAMAGLEWQQ